MRKAVVLLSGGLDSATAAAWARSQGYEVHALAVDYGQRHRVELGLARRIAAALGLASFRVVTVDLAALGGSALTTSEPVPKDRSDAQIGQGIPSTYVPARNTVLLGLALAAADVLEADAVVIGINALDCSGYPDCRPGFLQAMRSVAREGTRRGAEGRPLEVLAPLLADTKADIVRRGKALGVPWHLTLSCYDPLPATAGGHEAGPCGRCDACRLRARGFEQAGEADPTARG
ncbi:MAG: 7-cyano-7-deazaguanine synthase QueC [Planctomycetia bacterium]